MWRVGVMIAADEHRADGGADAPLSDLRALRLSTERLGDCHKRRFYRVSLEGSMRREEQS
jgi:hypothetical protein